jgi:hypothetical protein
VLFCTAAVLAAARPAAAQEAVVAGAGVTAGILGVEAHWPAAGSAVRIAVGAGIAGVGARAILPLRGAGNGARAAATTGYVSAGYLRTPWRLGRIDAAGAVVVERGVRILHGGERLLADLAAGVLLVHGGSWGGHVLGPALRLQVGVRPGR